MNMDVNTVLQILILIILFIGSLFLSRYLPSYFEEKGRNLATKEDIEEITAKVEEVRQVYTSELALLKAQLDLAQAKAMLYSTAYIEIISKLWAELQELKHIGDQLWETATPKSLSKFSENLISTQLMLEQSSLFISAEEYFDLKTVLNEFERFQLGKQALINLRSSEAVELVLKNFGELPASNHHSPMIENEIIRENSQAKSRYESLINDLGDRLRSQLDVSLPPIDENGSA